MHRADRKLQLSHNVVGENVMDHEGKEKMYSSVCLKYEHDDVIKNL